VLRKLGLPDHPVHRLTQLFEQARYSNEMTGKRDELEARDSLAAIVEACIQTEKETILETTGRSGKRSNQST